MIAPLAICAVALVVEALISYPEGLFRLVGHPVTWMGRALSWLDRHTNREADPPNTRRVRGALALLLLLTLVGFASWAVSTGIAVAVASPWAVIVLGACASTCLAQRSLDRHVAAVARALDCRGGDQDGLDAARRAVGAIVGRDTVSLNEDGIARAAIESLAENFADGAVAPAFWLALFGLPGGMIYKAINTADSMIGHRTPRHAAFGFAAAKLDDLVNWVPARLAALWLIMAAALIPGASATAAWRVTRRDARGHASPNAGWPEAAMAGALGLRLGGPRTYAGTIVMDLTIGEGDRRADAEAIRAALHLYRIACGLEILVVLSLMAIIARAS